MEEKVIIAYAILLAINTGIFILCAIQMRKFVRFYRNFNKVVNNVQSYLQYVMEDDSQQDIEDMSKNSFERNDQTPKMMELDREVPDKAPMPTEQKEAILNSVLGEIFS